MAHIDDRELEKGEEEHNCAVRQNEGIVVEMQSARERRDEE
jgi:hypothetical protein